MIYAHVYLNLQFVCPNCTAFIQIIYEFLSGLNIHNWCYMNMHHVDLNIHTYCTLYKFGDKMIPTVTLYSITYKYHDFMVRQSFDTQLYNKNAEYMVILFTRNTA